MRQSVTRRFTNTAPMTGPDPHSDPRNSPAARTQKSEFLKGRRRRGRRLLRAAVRRAVGRSGSRASPD